MVISLYCERTEEHRIQKINLNCDLSFFAKIHRLLWLFEVCWLLFLKLSLLRAFILLFLCGIACCGHYVIITDPTILLRISLFLKFLLSNEVLSLRSLLMFFHSSVLLRIFNTKIGHEKKKKLRPMSSLGLTLKWQRL